MILADMILANEVQAGNNSQILLNGLNNIFPVLSTPAFINFGVALVITGMNLTKRHDLVIEFCEDKEEDDNQIIFNEVINEDPNQLDPNPTLTANISLRNVRINDYGLHKIVLKFDGETVAKNTINIVKAN